jgi:competence protein ComEA
MTHRFMRAHAAALLLVLCTAVAHAGPVDINSADAATLAQELKGVGSNKAATIVEYRRTHGGFKTVDDLALVKGIGAKLVERNRADLRLGRFTPGTAGSPAVASTQSGGRTVLARPATTSPSAASARPQGLSGAPGVKGAAAGLSAGNSGK